MQRDEVAQLARTVLELRQRRHAHLPAILFGEHAWGLLLVLFVADADCERLTASQACERAGGSLSVGLRWLAVLDDQQLVTCHPACNDGHLVVLTPEGIHAVEACMNDARTILHLRSGECR